VDSLIYWKILSTAVIGFYYAWREIPAPHQKKEVTVSRRSIAKAEGTTQGNQAAPASDLTPEAAFENKICKLLFNWHWVRQCPLI
jgi:hypothetical protein